ncbi:MAG: PAS domain-containing protein, partial [Nevskiaceae bacterium]|nr:PAS domain-containing protein [Nevskiaceae bacterium]
MDTPVRPAGNTASSKLLPSENLDGIDESTWLDVIHKMDEVYTRLIDDEIELEKKNGELEQSQQFIVSVLTSMSDVLFVCDEAGHIEQTNAALCDLVGRDNSQLNGTPLAALLADEDSATQARAAMERAETSGADQSFELNLLDAQGQSVPVDASCTPRIGANGRRVGTVWVGRPMAEIKRAYNEMRAAHEALKRTQQQLLHSEKMASLGQLVAGVAHELNNPISFVLGNAHALRKYCDRLQTYLNAVHARQPETVLQPMRQKLRIEYLLSDLPSLIEGTLEGAQRTADIVQGLKRFSAMDPEERLPVDLVDVIDRAIHWVFRGRVSTIEVQWHPPPPCIVMGSDGQLQQIMMNLLQNALDALADTPDPVLGIDLAIEGGSVFVTVRDNGPGMPE